MNLETLRESIGILDCEIKDSGLKKLIECVLTRIPCAYKEGFPSFSIHEGPCKEGAYVTEDYVMFDPGKLNELCEDDGDAKIGFVAHELAHVFLRHGSTSPGLKLEDEADALATKWGFAKEIEAFRQKLGPATFSHI